MAADAAVYSLLPLSRVSLKRPRVYDGKDANDTPLFPCPKPYFASAGGQRKANSRQPLSARRFIRSAAVEMTIQKNCSVPSAAVSLFHLFIICIGYSFLAVFFCPFLEVAIICVFFNHFINHSQHIFISLLYGSSRVLDSSRELDI